MDDPPSGSLAHRFAAFIVAHAKLVLLLWFVVALGVRGTAPSWRSLALDGDFEYLPAHMQSVAADNLLNQAFPTDRPRSQVVIVISRDAERFDRADELASLDLLRRLHHRLAEVLLQRAETPRTNHTAEQESERRIGLWNLAKESLDEAIRIDEEYFAIFRKTADHETVPTESLRLTLAYWDRAELLQRMGQADAAGPDMQAALILDPDVAQHAVAISQRDLSAWSSLLDLLSWNDLVLGDRLRNSRARLIVLQSDAELAATHNIDFLAAIHQQVAETQSAHHSLLRPGLAMLATGSAAIGGETLTAARDAIRYTEWFTLLIILSILILVYRAPLLIAIPLVSIGLAVAVSTGAIAWLTIGSQSGWLPGLNIQIFTTSRIFLFVILFGAGTDYCLFLIARVREEVPHWPWDVAVSRALAGVSSALLGSAFTTIVGLGMLWTAEFGKYHHTGPMIAICLLIGLAVCMTLTPAILRLVGPRVFWPQVFIAPGSVPADQPQTENRLAGAAPLRMGQRIGDAPAGMWGMIALRLTTRPGLALVIGVGLLMFPAGYGWIHEHDVTYDISSQLSSSAESRRGFRKLDEHFGIGEVNPTTVLLVRPEEASANQLREHATALSAALHSLDGVAAVRSADDPLGDFPPQRSMSLLSKDAWKRRALKSHRIAQGYFFSKTPELAGRLVRLDVVMQGNPFDVRTAEQVSEIGRWLKAQTQDTESAWAGSEVFLAGTTPSIIDLRLVTLDDHRRIKFAVIVAVFVVLLLVIRRILLCGYLIATVLLSYYATLGLTILFFRWVYGDDYLGLDWKLPLFLFVILVAVGQDYNVYLVTRIIEEQRYRRGWLSALRRAVSKTGGIITACGLVMAGTFFSMTASAWFPTVWTWMGGTVTGSQTTLRGIVELGFALGLGVLLDTFYVRTILVPSFVALLDRFKENRGKPQLKNIAVASEDV